MISRSMIARVIEDLQLPCTMELKATILSLSRDLCADLLVKTIRVILSEYYKLTNVLTMPLFKIRKPLMVSLSLSF